jgi:hypothetical protein
MPAAASSGVPAAQALQGRPAAIGRRGWPAHQAASGRHAGQPARRCAGQGGAGPRRVVQHRAWAGPGAAAGLAQRARPAAAGRCRRRVRRTPARPCHGAGGGAAGRRRPPDVTSGGPRTAPGRRRRGRRPTHRCAGAPVDQQRLVAHVGCGLLAGDGAHLGTLSAMAAGDDTGRPALRAAGLHHGDHRRASCRRRRPPGCPPPAPAPVRVAGRQPVPCQGARCSRWQCAVQPGPQRLQQPTSQPGRGRHHCLPAAAPSARPRGRRASASAQRAAAPGLGGEGQARQPGAARRVEHVDHRLVRRQRVGRDDDHRRRRRRGRRRRRSSAVSSSMLRPSSGTRLMA